jgi:CRISPR/Cas system CSM-associated protein Csm2 small subunit
LRHLTETEAANGFANRFLWFMVKRSKELPFGGEWRTVDKVPLIERLEAALRFGGYYLEVNWSEGARKVWRGVYGPLSEGKPGMFGAVIGRAEAQTIRLAALYAVLDLSRELRREHIEAALALWEYAEESARYIFGDATGDPEADAILDALRAARASGLTRTQIRDLFQRNKSAERINQALALLLKMGKAAPVSEDTGGRPVERWFAK